MCTSELLYTYECKLDFVQSYMCKRECVSALVCACDFLGEWGKGWYTCVILQIQFLYGYMCDLADTLFLLRVMSTANCRYGGTEY